MRWGVAVVALALAAAMSAAGEASAGTFAQRMYASEAGSRPYWLYVPDDLAGSGVPLVVMLHGCTQDGPDFAAAGSS